MNKASEIYMKAAELVITGHPKWGGTNYSCVAVEAACDYELGFDAFVEAYAVLFKPPADMFIPDVVKAWGYLWGDTPQEREDCRVLALLFMSEIAKEEE